MTDRRLCAAITNAGKPCPNYALPDAIHAGMCFSHSKAAQKKKIEKIKQTGRQRRYPDFNFLVPDEISDDWVINQLQMVVQALNKRDATPETARALTTALSTLDRALERRDKKAKPETIITIEYDNNWRHKNTPAVSAYGTAASTVGSEEVQLAVGGEALAEDNPAYEQNRGTVHVGGALAVGSADV